VELAAAADPAVYTEEIVTTDTLFNNNVEFIAAVTPTVYNEEIVDADTLANNDEELVTVTAPANTKTHERGACREVPDREERRDSAERQVQVATYTWIKILKNICAKS
jgi:hypothetical protein